MMSNKNSSFLNRLSHNRLLSKWSRLERLAPKTDFEALRALRLDARDIMGRLEAFLRVAEDRLAVPHLDHPQMRAPIGTDWVWRPQMWSQALRGVAVAAAQSQHELGADLTLFHDCAISELTLRQLRNTREADLAPYGLRMDVFRFDGSFLSLVLDLPPSGVEGLRLSHLLRLDLRLELEKPLEIFARLNVKHGPNIEQLVREIAVEGETDAVMEFDLAFAKVNEKRIEKVWIDLIFEGPQMNQVVLRDLNVSRRPRAAM